MSGGISYSLAVKVEYMRKATMSSLLYALAYKALRDEANGAAWEQVHAHLTGDGDYQATALVDRNGVSE